MRDLARFFSEVLSIAVIAASMTISFRIYDALKQMIMVSTTEEVVVDDKKYRMIR